MRIRSNGIELCCEIHGGQGPWLVLSHSLACSMRMWDPQIEALRGHFRVLAFDTRGHGASDAPPGPYTLEMLADDAKGLLEALGIVRCHWVGLSMGGMIGQTFALRYPEVFESLVLADTTSRYPPEAAKLWQERIRVAETEGMAPLVEPTLARWFTPAFRERRPEVCAAVGALIRSTPVAGYAGCSRAIPSIDLTHRLREIRCPILIVCGEDDPGTPPAMSHEMHAAAPGSRLVILPQAAHLANLEQPEAFTRALRGFLPG